MTEISKWFKQHLEELSSDDIHATLLGLRQNLAAYQKDVALIAAKIEFADQLLEERARPQWQWGDYVDLVLPFTGNAVYHQFVVASDTVESYDLDDPCWTVAADENDWSQVGSLVTTQYVNDHQPLLLHRIPHRGIKVSYLT